MARPVAVAITGGIGAGKSEALAAFARHGAATVSSDQIVHRLIREDSRVRKALLDRFGERILDEAGQIDRSAIAEIVFPDRPQLEWLEGLLHPLVVQEYLEWREQLADLPNPPPGPIALSTEAGASHHGAVLRPADREPLSPFPCVRESSPLDTVPGSSPSARRTLC